jgi:hypothetical protein
LCYEGTVDDVLDEKAILERIREHLRTPPETAPRPRAPRPPPVAASAEDVEIDVAALQGAQDIYALPLRSQRPALGPALVLVNGLLRKLLKPSLERQVSYNAANERLVRLLLGEMESLKRAQAALTERCGTLESELAALRDAKRGG